MACQKSKPVCKAVTMKAFVAWMLEAKAFKVFQKPGAQKKNTIPIMAQV